MPCSRRGSPSRARSSPSPTARSRPGPSSRRARATRSSRFRQACATLPRRGVQPAALPPLPDRLDDAERFGGAIFAGNQFVDRNALRPVARAYDEYVPGAVRKRLHNFVANLKEPAIAVNDVLQANFDRAWTATQRFVVNSTVGGAGLFDVASDWDLPFHEADFGQTLGVWGVGTGPSVQLPLFGPSNVRDSVGKVVGFVANPLGFIPGGTMAAIETGGSGIGLVDGRANLLSKTDALEKTSLDYYATLRSVEAQRRAQFVEEGRTGGQPDLGPIAPVPDVTLAPATP